MVRRGLALSAAAALLLPLAPAAVAAPDPAPPGDASQLEGGTASPAGSLDRGPVMALGEARGKELYVVQLETPPVPARDSSAAQSKAGQATAQRQPTANEHRRELREEQAELRGSIARITGSTPKVRFSYTEALNGIAVQLTRQEARRVARLDGVAAVQVDEERELTTDVGPEWIGAPAIWDGSATPAATPSKGEGVVVGVIDSGINPANPSFAASVPEADGGDGHEHTNPRGPGSYVGVCDPANTGIFVPDWGCNDKLIGAWSFTVNEPGSPYDDNGHGTHTASTSAGNQVDATTYSAEGTANEFSATRNIKGVAPHANLIAYDVCVTGCSLAAITAAINQAILDEVDVINYSIGSSSPSSAWTDLDAIGFRNARAAGIHVATSAGNDGPGAATLGSPADVPWITSVGATQHNRQWQGRVENLTADGGATLGSIQGVTFSAATDGAFPLVYAGDLGSPLCLAAELAGQDLSGQIVVCDRGQTGRVEKGEVVLARGAEGMVLANDAASGDSINADPHVLPAVHITHDDGVTLKTWMADVQGEQASLSGGLEHVDDDVADIMAGFSSRGPNRAMSVVGPSVSAPGVDILAANGADNEVSWGFISGTSMASPHTAGAMALLRSVHGDWTPAELQSALMTTAHTGVLDIDGSDADWFDMGSGRIDLNQAAQAGLLLDETQDDYVAADPALGGDVRTLNTASMADNQCLQECSWTRTVTGTGTGAGDWTVSGAAVTDGVTVTVEPSSFTIAEGQEVDLTVTADVAGASTDAWQFGQVVLTPADGSDAPEAHLPVAVLPSTGVLPSSIDIRTRRDAGSQQSPELRAIEITDLDVRFSGLVPEQVEQVSVPQDETNDNPYDGNGTEVVQVQVPEGATRLLARLTDATAPDFDLFVGRGAVEPANEECRSTTGGSAERCEIGNPEPGTWWILIQNWEASDPAGEDTADLRTAVVAGDAGNLTAEGPSAVPSGDPFTIRTFWNEPAMEAGDTWHGALTLGSSPASAGDIGTIPVTVERLADDVTKTVDVEEAAPGDTLRYTVTVQPNVTPEDLTYTITDSLPEGTTYVEGSATDGATVEDGVLTWSGEVPSTFGDEGSYSFTSSAGDPSCVNPFTGAADYTNLEDFGVLAQPGITGDSQVFDAFGTLEFGFFGSTYAGLTFSDDGFLVFDAASNYAGTPWEPQAVPDSTLPNNLVAPLWQDMQIVYDEATNSGVSLAQTGSGLAIVEYDDMRLFDDNGGALGTFDLQVFAQDGSSDYVFAYDNLTGPLDEVTIGAENATGTIGSTLVNNGDASGAISDGTVVCATYEGPAGEATELSYQVTVDDSVHNGQVLTNDAVHTTDDPGAREETATADVTVVGARELAEVDLTLDPDEVELGGASVATVVVSSAGQTPTGTVQVLVDGVVAGSGVLDAAGQVKLRLTDLDDAGVFPVVAQYLGDATTHPATSSPVNLAVGQATKVRPKLKVKAPKKIKVGKRKKLKVTVTAPVVTLTGDVRVRLRLGGVRVTLDGTLNKAGKAKIRLPRFSRPGRVRARVTYLGDAVTRRAKTSVVLRVVRR